MAEAVGICLLVQPELLVAAVIVVGAIAVAAAIAAELEKGAACDEMFTACLETGIAGIREPLYRHSQCHACRDVCVQNGGAWSATANGKPCL